MRKPNFIFLLSFQHTSEFRRHWGWITTYVQWQLPPQALASHHRPSWAHMLSRISQKGCESQCSQSPLWASGGQSQWINAPESPCTKRFLRDSPRGLRPNDDRSHSLLNVPFVILSHPCLIISTPSLGLRRTTSQVNYLQPSPVSGTGLGRTQTMTKAISCHERAS